jgi:hypothetical protein
MEAFKGMKRSDLNNNLFEFKKEKKLLNTLCGLKSKFMDVTAADTKNYNYFVK